MIQKLIFNAPFNSLSFGNVSYNMLRELYKKDIEVIVFPEGNIDLSAFNPTQEFLAKFSQSVQDRYKKYSKDIPTLKMWHINGSEKKLTNKHFLYTFHELDFATQEEINIVNSQEHTFFSSRYSENIFKTFGGDESKISSVPIGFDIDFHNTNKKYYGDDVISFGISGKFEKRKNTAKLLNLWAKRFGNDKRYVLNAAIINQFFKPEDMNALISNALEGKRYWNINFLNFMKTNAEVNDFLNCVDIDLSGISNAEGWNLGAFNSTCLGKWSIVTNCTSHKDWATKDNCILINPDGKQPALDGAFFHQNQPFNQGNTFSVSDEIILNAFEKSLSFAKKQNEEGIKLRQKFTYESTMDQIVSKIEEKCS